MALQPPIQKMTFLSAQERQNTSNVAHFLGVISFTKETYFPHPVGAGIIEGLC
jgi:hypothetical protein